MGWPPCLAGPSQEARPHYQKKFRTKTATRESARRLEADVDLELVLEDSGRQSGTRKPAAPMKPWKEAWAEEEVENFGSVI